MKLKLGKKFHMPSPNKMVAAKTRKPAFLKGIGKPPSMVK